MESFETYLSKVINKAVRIKRLDFPLTGMNFIMANDDIVRLDFHIDDQLRAAASLSYNGNSWYDHVINDDIKKLYYRAQTIEFDMNNEINEGRRDSMKAFFNNL